MENTDNLDLSVCDWRFLCPKRWNDLDKTENSKVRFCKGCGEYVFLCETEAEKVALTNHRRCIALPIASPEPALEVFTETDDWMFLGEIEVLEPETPPYEGPWMRIIIEPTHFLSEQHLTLIAYIIGFQREPNHLGQIFADGRSHILKRRLTPDQAKDLSKEWNEAGITNYIEPEPGSQ
jgi:hypothetical protein